MGFLFVAHVPTRRLELRRCQIVLQCPWEFPRCNEVFNQGRGAGRRSNVWNVKAWIKPILPIPSMYLPAQIIFLTRGRTSYCWWLKSCRSWYMVWSQDSGCTKDMCSYICGTKFQPSAAANDWQSNEVAVNLCTQTKESINLLNHIN